ncbi:MULTISPECIES: hypothetical protein [unclassified Aureimonas]|uniref:hypothetical protein n=1 Tax=unclassified Aureimonas TaxID=2615206 RepID=UPI000700A9BB|nr:MULTISPECIES: hypothetical protein [unclassified Aureimonas]KQT52559.1 hypothetical protein ASG62_15250 [Aureimonas sp. Leaf427]KQT77540.1 hypothetical protein ASG54_11160 [Aureimonas sp. Leaf460]
MNFADILDDIARPRSPGGAGGAYGGHGHAPAFWSVLDSIAAAAPVSETAARQAYRPEAPRSPLPGFDGAMHASDLSIDADDIAYELDLDAVASVEELSILRRRFARLNHPDRVEAGLRERANTRMTIANAMIDAAARCLVG